MNRLIVGMVLGEEFGIDTVRGDLNPDTPHGLAVIIGKASDYVVVGDDDWQVTISQYSYGVEAKAWGPIDDATVLKLARADERLNGLIRFGLQAFASDDDVGDDERAVALDLGDRMRQALRPEA